MRLPKPLLVVPTELLTPELRKKLDRSGYIVVESAEPEKFRVIQPPPAVTVKNVDMLYDIAMEVVMEHYSGPSEFGKKLLARLKKARALPPSPPTGA